MDNTSSDHRTGALSRLLATLPEELPEAGPEVLLSAVLDAAGDGLIVVSTAGKVLTYNDRFVEIWEIPRPTLLTRDEPQVLAALVKRLSDPAAFVNHVEAMTADQDARAEGHCLLLDGRTVEHITRPVVAMGRWIGRAWTFRDITASVRAFEQLHESEERFRVFADSAAYGMVMNADDLVVYANEAAGRMMGCAASELIGLPVSALVPEEDRATMRARAEARKLASGSAATRYETRILRRDGEVRLAEMGVSSIQVKDKRAVVVTLVDLTERRRAEAEAVHLASHDGLTHLPNRAFFRHAVDQAIAEGHQAGTGLGVIFIGLDRFKSANFLGHKLGDLVLLEASERIRALVRPLDLVARLGSDEFAVLLRGCDLSAAMALAQLMVARLREPYRLPEDNELFLSASAGASSFPEDASGTTELMGRANIALIAAKERGKDQAVAFERELTTDAATRVEMNRFLHRSVRDHAFFLEFQPIARTHDLGVTGFEALVRSRDLMGRRVPPDAFIPIAEATGLVVPMGRIVLDLALGAIRELNMQRATPLRVAINASAIQLRHPTFVRDIRAGLDQHALPASALAVEITETNALTDPEGTKRVLRELRSAGISISLDDFGTGFASIDLLRSLPLDVVKIDRSFTRDIDTDLTQAAIVTSVIELSHRLGMKVVAEGVETESQQQFLLSHGCDLIQGYWLARPLSLEASVDFLHSRERRRI